jgi:hypothetical protein
MPKILTWDIAVKTLSYCLMDFPEIIENKLVYSSPQKWNIINLINDNTDIKCQHINPKKIACHKSAKFIDTNTNNNTNTTTHYCGVHKKTAVNAVPIKSSKVSDFTPYEIQKLLVSKLDQLPELYEADYIVLENQPTTNIYMKTLAHSILTYYTIKTSGNNITKNIMFINANFKTNLTKIPYDGEPFLSTKKSKYDKRKETSIVYCKYFLQKFYQPEITEHWQDFLQTHKSKLDDLADAFNMAICSIWQIHYATEPKFNSSNGLEELKALAVKNNIELTKRIKNGNLTEKTYNQLKSDLQERFIW